MSDLADRDSIGLLFQGDFESFERLDGTLFAQTKSPMVNGDQITAASGIGHPDSLFGSAMGTSPRGVGSDRHECNVEGSLAAKVRESGAEGSITAEEYFSAFTFENIAVVAAIGITTPSSTPMIDFECRDIEGAVFGSDSLGLPPAEFGGSRQRGPGE